MKTSFKLTVLVFTTLFFLGCKTSEQKNTVKILTPTEFKEKSLNQVIIDIRTPQEFSQGHIEGAVNINYFDADFLDQIGKYEKTTPIFLYCRSGNRTSSAAVKIAKMGYTDLYDLEGGITNWARANFQINK